MIEARKTAPVLTGRTVAAICVGFFLIVIGVNISLAWFAIETSSGEVATEPYRKGLHYNDRIAADELQTALGWRDTVSLSTDGKVLHVAITDAAAQPVRRLAIEGTISHPATRSGEQTVSLQETADGSYTSAVSLSPGTYIADITVRTADRPDTIAFRGRQRLWLKP